jgi:hypothetical protein
MYSLVLDFVWVVGVEIGYAVNLEVREDSSSRKMLASALGG